MHIQDVAKKLNICHVKPSINPDMISNQVAPHGVNTLDFSSFKDSWQHSA